MSSVSENRSLFNRRPSYDNMSIVVENDARYSYSSDSHGYAIL